ncbi:hypothetical protein HF923_02010 [Acidithiobacillus ferriphilus]|uniref:hypothetical protein n=1 Tax=Acidithiobacillus ferriphilus TaxID=1689834 RepID=UPI001C06D8B7|nr:hypothetical protein [Acidithiobacillus ferriphilus]MBU2844623.1 hypothetical protein [Acidithiobacillus ferriphilus]
MKPATHRRKSGKSPATKSIQILLKSLTGPPWGVNHSGGWLISLIFDGQTARVFLWARSSVEMLTPDCFAAAW